VGGTVRVVRTLVALKRKYPDRVTLILGNRDLNKMRWTAQLAFEPNSFVPETGFAMWAEWNALHRVDGPCWVADAEKRAGMTPAAYYRKMIAKSKGCAASDVSEADVSQFDTVANRIRWHFKEMMGADGEFERRRAELTLLSEIQRGRDSAVEATEADVVCSTVESVQAGGFMREYLELGQLAHIHANCLYMHGGIVGGGCAEGEHAVGALPQADAREDDVHEWVRRLNDWKSAQIGEWIREPNWSGRRDGGGSSGGESVGGGGGGGGTPWRTLDGYVLHGGGQELQDYGLFTDNGPTVVLGRHLQKTGMPMHVPDDAMLKLNKAGIRRLILGHTPHGTCPTIIKSGGPGMVEPGLMVVMADTSYSDMKAADCRGRAVSEVQLLDDGKVRVHGVLPDGKQLCYALPDGIGATDPPELVGWEVPPVGPAMASAVGPDVPEMLGKDAFFVKAFLESGSQQSYLLQHVNGFVNKYVYLRPNEVTRMFQAQMEALLHGGPSDDAPPVPVPYSASSNSSNSHWKTPRRLELSYHLIGDDESTMWGGHHHKHAIDHLSDHASEQLSHETRSSYAESSSEHSLTQLSSPVFRLGPDRVPDLLRTLSKALSSSTPSAPQSK